MYTFKELFSVLDSEARKLGEMKGLFAGLYMRENVSEEDKIRLAKAFISEAQESLHEMSYALKSYQKEAATI